MVITLQCTHNLIIPTTSKVSEMDIFKALNKWWYKGQYESVGPFNSRFEALYSRKASSIKYKA